jgi:hypothetical protein
MVVSVDTETEKVLQCNRAVMETLRKDQPTE